MKHTRIYRNGLLAAVLLTAVGCSDITPQTELAYFYDYHHLYDFQQYNIKYSPPTLEMPMVLMTRELIRENEGQSVSFSPLGIQYALSMACNGAKGETMMEFGKVGLLSSNDTAIALNNSNRDNKWFITNLSSLDDFVEVEAGNSVWSDKEYSLKPSFVNLMNDNYDAQARSVDFSKDLAQVQKWCVGKMQGVTADFPKRLDREIHVVSSLTFKAKWMNQFDKKKTQKDAFYMMDGVTVSKKADYMRGKMSIPYWETEDFSMAMIPFGEGRYYLTVILPAPGVTFEKCMWLLNLKISITLISKDNLEYPFLPKCDYMVDVRLPKFEINMSPEIENVIYKHGVRQIFSGMGDLSNMTDEAGARIRLNHAVNLSFDEDGCRASGIKGVPEVLRYGKSETEYEHAEFNVNRPFMYMIHTYDIMNVLFAGVVLEP